MPQINPAICLHRLLDALCKMQENDPASKCFAMLLVVPQNDSIKVLRRVSSMAELVDDIERRVRAIPGIDTGRYLAWKPFVSRAFAALSLAGTIKAFSDQIKTSNSLALERLWYCAHLLEHRGREPEIEGPRLGELKNEILALSREVAASEVDPELKVFLQYQLGMLADAIDEYHLFGRGPMEKAKNSLIGELLTNPRLGRDFAGEPIGTKVWVTLSHYADVLTVTDSAVRLYEFARKVLSLP